ncbi:hypothetical protein ACFVYJ_01420 [Pontibacter sp. JAM-7]|uniref:hypothetical protein n=1 Tax=Pontibacter sp. JAM-7 TaxID=3366581 RepID=UPI003AF91465
MSTQLERDYAAALRTIRRLEKDNSTMRKDMHKLCGQALAVRGASEVKSAAQQYWDKHQLYTLDNVTQLCSYPSCDCPEVRDEEPAHCAKGYKQGGKL